MSPIGISEKKEGGFGGSLFFVRRGLKEKNNLSGHQKKVNIFKKKELIQERMYYGSLLNNECVFF